MSGFGGPHAHPMRDHGFLANISDRTHLERRFCVTIRFRLKWHQQGDLKDIVMLRILGILAASVFLCLCPANAGDPWDGTAVSDDDLPSLMTQDGTDRPGSDFWLIRMRGPAAFGPCAAYCRGTPRCGAFTVVRPTEPGGQYLCYLKDQIPALVRNGCCLSGIKEGWRPITAAQIAANPRLGRTPNAGEPFPPPRRPIPPGALQTPPPITPISPIPPTAPPAEPGFGPPVSGVTNVDGVDRLGNDYRRIFPATTARACAEACAGDQPRCRAYTFVKAGYQEAQPVCYLKAPAPSESPDPCCVSGVSQSPEPPAPPPPGMYERSGGRYEGAGDALLNNLAFGDRRWPAGVPFDVSGCEQACDAPGRFTGSTAEARTCAAYTFQRAFGPNPAVCTTFTRVPPRLVADPNTTSGRRR